MGQTASSNAALAAGRVCFPLADVDSTLRLVLAGALCVAVSGCHKSELHAGTGEHLDFNQDVQPVLASNCFNCHGPDPEMRKGGLRLDLEELAKKKRPGHPDAIVPGYPEQSELIRRIESKDPHHLMPQSSDGAAKPMKPEEIAVLKEWVKEGAVYRPHWAFDNPVRPAVSAVTEPGLAGNDAWSKNPIDAFVLARLKKVDLHPSPEADKETLIRRVTLDLTGLLPTPAEVKAFVNDNSPQAYEHLVDNLLARPAYGEQRARYWLDYARYADTYGQRGDKIRSIWPYRDYVIRSFNQNKPFDQFVVEQIAGDLLPAKNLDPLIASGYVRLGVNSNSSIPQQARVDLARERAEAYGAAFMGLTLGCAVCHDHKYDPTTQKDFYSLSAFFNNMDERPIDTYGPVWEPMVRVPRPEHQAEYDRVLEERSKLWSQLGFMRQHERELVSKWLDSKQNPPEPVSTDKLLLRLRLDEGKGTELKNSAPGANPASFHTTGFKPEWGEQTWLWPDFRTERSTHVPLGQMGDFEANQAFSAGGWFMPLLLEGMKGTPIGNGALMSKMDSTQHNRGWDLSARDGRIVIQLVSRMSKREEGEETLGSETPEQHGFHYPTPDDLTENDLVPELPPQLKAKREKEDKEARKAVEKERAKEKAKWAGDTSPQVAIEVMSIPLIYCDGEWKHFFFTYDGSGKASGVKIYLNGRQLATKVLADSLHGETIRTQAPMQLGWRNPDKYPASPTRYQDVRVYGRSLTPDEVKRLPFEDYVAELAAKPTSQWNKDEWHAAGEFYLNSLDKSFPAIEEQIKPLDAQLNKLSTGGALTMVSWERPSMAYANVLTRGAYLTRAERVEANTPHFLPPLPADAPHNRLSLAKWTVSEDNPLTARVTVNRMWNELFGAGVVETTEDFGIMGQRPSNPALLDWLAVEFRESGWNVKHMYKLMAMSAAYRQSAKSTPEQLAKDPKNLLLSHGPRFRMDAEMLRDISLQSSGLLANKIGGPSVMPYQPPGLWEQVDSDIPYLQDHGESLYRRSMYSFWKRMAMMPDMDAFDAPMRDVVCTRRQHTNTPLQALVSMNDVQWIEAARGLAQRAILEGGKQPSQRIGLISEILLSHDPSPKMESVLEKSLADMQEHYAEDPKAAHELLQQGESKHDPSIPEPELAAYTIVASEMLNRNETINK